MLPRLSIKSRRRCSEGVPATVCVQVGCRILFNNYSGAVINAVNMYQNVPRSANPH